MGQDRPNDCRRFQDFEALYMRGEEQLGRRKGDATAATNSLVFNAFIWLQVCPSLCPLCLSTPALPLPCMAWHACVGGVCMR